MEKIRIGNDIVINWAIYTGDDDYRTPYDLQGKDIAFYVKTVYGRKRIYDYTIDGNILTWSFKGKDQEYECVYSMELVENEGANGMRTVDESDAFRLVGRLCDCICCEADQQEEEVEIIYLRFSTSWGMQLIEIIDDLNSDDSGAALSARQGKVLKQIIDVMGEGFIPLSRDFSDDFNNDFAR